MQISGTHPVTREVILLSWTWLKRYRMYGFITCVYYVGTEYLDFITNSYSSFSKEIIKFMN